MTLNTNPREEQLPRFRHSWTDKRRTRLTSKCLSCSAVVASGMDELSLLTLEQQHVCEPQPNSESGDL